MTCILGTTYIAEFDPFTLIAVSPDLWPPTGLTLGGEYGHRSRYLSQATNSYVAYFWRATYLRRSIFDWASVLEHNQNCCCVFGGLESRENEFLLLYSIILIVFRCDCSAWIFYHQKTVTEVTACLPLRGIHTLFLLLTVQWCEVTKNFICHCILICGIN